MNEAVRIVTPLRFVAGVIGLWTAARLAILLPGDARVSLDPVAPAQAGAYLAVSPPRPLGLEGSGVPAFAGMTGKGEAPRKSAETPPSPFVERSRDTSSSEAEKPRIAASTSATWPKLTPSGKDEPDRSISPTGLLAPTPSASPSRWSGNLYLFRRSHSGSPSLATGGQLGGSQAGARLAYRLNPTGPTRLAAAARLSSPLDDTRGAEAAVGIDWHPLPAAPFRISVERRVDIGGSGRDAWSAYAAGGFWHQSGRLVVDGYAQAGIVGARRRDLFADGAVRAGYRADLGTARSLTVGTGAWAAAQPGVEQLDIGPRVALGLAVGGTAATLAAEWRVRVAGDAAPRTGLAITLAADF